MNQCHFLFDPLDSEIRRCKFQATRYFCITYKERDYLRFFEFCEDHFPKGNRHEISSEEYQALKESLKVLES